MTTTQTPAKGYDLGSRDIPAAPIGRKEWELLKVSVLFTDDDVQALRMSEPVLAEHVEEVLDVWCGFMASRPPIVAAFGARDTGEPDQAYLDAARARFGRWLMDTAKAQYDETWLAYQFEIGRRHHRSGKNRTDGVDAAEHVPYRYLLGLVYPFLVSLEPFLAKGGHGKDDVERMQEAWRKSVLLQLLLWSHPYVREGDW